MQTATNTHPPIFSTPRNGMTAGNARSLPVVTATRKRQTKGVVTVPPYTGNIVTIPLSERPHGFTEIKLGGRVYTLSPTYPPQQGQYYWDYLARSLSIFPYYNVSGLSLSYQIPRTRRLISMELTDHPEWFNRFIVAKFDLKRQFQGHPSATLAIVTPRAKHHEIEEFFPVGKPFVIKGIGLRVSGCQFEEKTNIVTADDRAYLATLPEEEKVQEEARIRGQSYYLMTIAFQGHWESFGQSSDSPLDKPISMRSLISLGNNLTGLPIAQTGATTTTYTINQVATKAGVTIRGNSRRIKVNIPIPQGETITLRQLLTNERFYPDGKFINWENPNYIELLDWETMPAYVLPDRKVELSGTCGTFPIKLTNAQLILDTRDAESEKGDVWAWVTTGRADYQSPPKRITSGWTYENFNLEELRTAAWCFDNTSDKTPYKQTLLLNGEPILELEEEWGWIYTTADVYTFYYDSNNEPVKVFQPTLNVEWGLVKQTEKIYIHTKTDGNYLKEVQGTIRQLNRLNQEKGQEAIDLVIEIDQETDADTIELLQKRLAAYTNFFWVTYPYSRVDTLDDLEKYYPDITKSEENSDSYIPSLFSKASIREEGFTSIFPNPESTPEEPLPDIIVGTEEREKQQIIITSTRPQRFKTLSEITSKGGQNKERSSGAFDGNEELGQPPTARRIEYFGKNAKREENEGDRIPLKHLISTHDTPPKTNLSDGTVSFPDVRRLAQGVKGVDTQYSIENSRLEGVNIGFNDQLPVVMGQKIIHEGETLRVFELTETWAASSNINLESVDGTFGKNIVIKSKYKSVLNGKETV